MAFPVDISFDISPSKQDQTRWRPNTLYKHTLGEPDLYDRTLLYAVCWCLPFQPITTERLRRKRLKFLRCRIASDASNWHLYSETEA